MTTKRGRGVIVGGSREETVKAAHAKRRCAHTCGATRSNAPHRTKHTRGEARSLRKLAFGTGVTYVLWLHLMKHVGGTWFARTLLVCRGYGRGGGRRNGSARLGAYLAAGELVLDVGVGDHDHEAGVGKGHRVGFLAAAVQEHRVA